MAVAAPYSNYQQMQAETASPGKLVVMLFDGVIRFAQTACECLRGEDEVGLRYNLMRAQNILVSLMGSLDLKRAGELGPNLLRLYDFIYDRLQEAGEKRDLQALELARNMLSELREGWAQADIAYRQQIHDHLKALQSPAAGSARTVGARNGGLRSGTQTSVVRAGAGRGAPGGQ